MPARLTVTGLVLLMVALPGSAQSAVFGSLTQLPGLGGCVQIGSPQRCEVGRGLAGAGYVTLSPDDAFVYAVSFEGIAAFARDSVRGTLTQLPGSAGCVTDRLEGRDPTCAAARGAFFAEDSMIALSPDGRNAYAANAAGVTIFSRDPASGVLSQLPGLAGCTAAVESAICTRAHGVAAPMHVAVSPDGRSVYVAAFNSAAVAVFSRAPATGAITQLPGTQGCLSARRDQGCARGRAVGAPQALTVSPDGRYVYLAAFEGVAVFARDKRTGALTQLPGRYGCISRWRQGCARARGLEQEANSVAVTPDGRYLYVGSATCGGPCLGSITAFRRNRRSGALTRLRGRAGCVTERGLRGCSRARPLGYTRSLALSSDGRSAYAVGGNYVVALSRTRRSGALRQLTGPPGITHGRAIAYTRWVALSSDGRNAYVASEDSSAVAIFARHR